jgi:S-disulfanyl-L-cysteine oxidoreductase SoxD
MFSWRESALLLALFAACTAAAQTERYPGIGRNATAKEIAAWDIDVRPDFKGLPQGAGSVANGMQVWESQCASCHGFFGESNQFFSPIVGGTTVDDIRAGRVARLNDPSFPGRTTLMKLPTLSTLWDYIRRAMPWTQPKSLSAEEVYAVTAYILNLSGLVPDDFTLSDKNIAEVQQRLPNRNGMTTEHALWPGAGARQPDVKATACMKDCAQDVKVVSSLPDFARDAHGNLAEQNRAVGAQKGADTRRSTRPTP